MLLSVARDDRATTEGIEAIVQPSSRKMDLRLGPCGERSACINQVDRLIAPAIGELGLSAVIAVAQVVDRNLIAMKLNPGGSRGIGSPIGIIRRLQTEPPCQYHAKTKEAGQGPTPSGLRYEKDQYS